MAFRCTKRIRSRILNELEVNETILKSRLIFLKILLASTGTSTHWSHTKSHHTTTVPKNRSCATIRLRLTNLERFNCFKCIKLVYEILKIISSSFFRHVRRGDWNYYQRGWNYNQRDVNKNGTRRDSGWSSLTRKHWQFRHRFGTRRFRKRGCQTVNVFEMCQNYNW